MFEKVAVSLPLARVEHLETLNEEKHFKET